MIPLSNSANNKSLYLLLRIPPLPEHFQPNTYAQKRSNFQKFSILAKISKIIPRIGPITKRLKTRYLTENCAKKVKQKRRNRKKHFSYKLS